MIAYTTKIVINTEFGGFYITEEMQKWLKDKKGWSDKDLTYPYDTELRTHPHLVECVETLQRKHKKKIKDMSYSNAQDYRSDHRILDLDVVEIDVHLNVVDVYDGKEKVECWASEK